VNLGSISNRTLENISSVVNGARTDGGFPVSEVVKEMEKRGEYTESLLRTAGREKRAHRCCKNRFSVEIHIDYSDGGQS
jgi:hypothetical protein